MYVELKYPRAGDLGCLPYTCYTANNSSCHSRLQFSTVTLDSTLTRHPEQSLNNFILSLSPAPFCCGLVQNSKARRRQSLAQPTTYFPHPQQSHRRAELQRLLRSCTVPPDPSAADTISFQKFTLPRPNNPFLQAPKCPPPQSFTPNSRHSGMPSTHATLPAVTAQH